MARRTTVLASVPLVLLLAGFAGAQKKGPTETQVLVPDVAFSGGLITGVVLGPDDNPIANTPVAAEGGFPAVITGEVLGDEEDKTAAKTPGPPQKPPSGQPPDVKPRGTIAPVDTPQACAQLIQQAQGIVAKNPGSEHILIGLLVPAVQKIREAANSPASEVREAATSPSTGISAPSASPSLVGPSDSRSGGGIWVQKSGGGLATDANGRFAFCAAPDAKNVQVALGDGSVRKIIPAGGTPAAGCDRPPQFFQPNQQIDFCKLTTKAIIVQGDRRWNLPSARAYSPNGDRVMTAVKLPRDLGPGQAEFSFFDDQGQKQSFTGGVFKVVNASIDRDKLRSHQDAAFEYDIAFNFEPAALGSNASTEHKAHGNEPGSSQSHEPHNYGQLCVAVSTSGPISLVSAPEQQLQVNGDGHAAVKGKIRATQVAPGSAVPFGIKLSVLGCATGHH